VGFLRLKQHQTAKKIKPIALAIVNSEGIGRQLSQSVENSVNNTFKKKIQWQLFESV